MSTNKREPSKVEYPECGKQFNSEKKILKNYGCHSRKEIMGTPRRDVEAKAIMPAQAQSEQVQISFLQEKIKLTNGYAWWGYFIVLIGMFSMLYSMFVGIPFLILGIIYWMICYNAKST